MPNVSKTIRLTGDELRAVHDLMPHFPEIRSEADMIYALFRDGLLVRAAQANVPGATPYAGFVPGQLAALLERHLLPVIAFLLDHGALKYFLHPATPPTPPGPGGPPETIHLAGPAAFVDDAAKELDALGADFL